MEIKFTAYSPVTKETMVVILDSLRLADTTDEELDYLRGGKKLLKEAVKFDFSDKSKKWILNEIKEGE